MGPGPEYRWNYLTTDTNNYRQFANEKAFLRNIYIPLVSKALGNPAVKRLYRSRLYGLGRSIICVFLYV